MKFIQKFKWLSIGAFIAWFVLPVVVYAVNVTVPQSTQKGDLVTGQTTGNYQLLHPGTDNNCLIASSTSPNGLVWSSCATGGTGISNLNGQVGATQTFATSVSGSIFNITSSGNVHTFTIPTGVVLNSYASSTFPSFSYGTSTYATILNYPTYTYASSAYATLWNLKAGSNITISTSSGVTISASGGTGSIGTSTNATVGKLAVWTGAATLGNSIVWDNGSVAGVNGTSSLYTFYVNGNLGVVGTTTLSSATTTINGATYYWPTAVPNANKILQSDSSGNLSWVTDQTGGGGSVSGGQTGYVTTWASSTGLTFGKLIDNGTVAGFNATSSTVSFNIQGTSGSSNTIFNVASSNASSILAVAPNASVGINTSSPVGVFTVASSTSSTAQSVLNVASSGYVGVGLNNPSYNVDIAVASSTSITPIRLGFAPGIAGANNDTINLLFSGNGSGGVSHYRAKISGYTENANTNTGGMSFSVVPSTDAFNEAMRITSASKVGINEGNPASRLSINGEFSLGDQTFAETTAPINGAIIKGVVGIGTTTPAAMLYVQGVSGTTTPLLTVASSSGTNYFTVASNGSTTLSSLGTGLVRSSSGSLYTDTTAYQTALTNPVTGTGVAGQVPIWSGTTAQTGDAAFLWSTSNHTLSINSSTPQATFVVQGSSTAPTLDVLRVASSSNTTLFNITSKGYVGVSSSTPTAQMVIQNSAGTNDIFRMASSSGALLSIFDYQGHLQISTTTDTANLAIQGVSAQTMNFVNISSSSGASLFTVTGSGYVGINSSSPFTNFVIDTGTAVGSASTTLIIPQKFQIDTYNSAGTRVCLTIVGTTPTVTSGACP